MAIELVETGLVFESEKKLNVLYNGQVVGNFAADFYFESGLIVELKAIECSHPIHLSQVIRI